MKRSFALTVLVLLLGAGGFVAGYGGRARAARRPPVIRFDQGVPVGVRDSPTGAIAAAENYLAAEDQALTSAAALRGVVAADWAPTDQQPELSLPFPAATLAGRPATFAGLRLTAAVAAAKLESYSPGSAEIRVWHEITAWSATVAPTQRWMLDTVKLVWSSGRWAIAARSSTPDAATPVPAWTNGQAQDRTASAYDSRLSGMSGPFYEGTGS